MLHFQNVPPFSYLLPGILIGQSTASKQDQPARLGKLNKKISGFSQIVCFGGYSTVIGTLVCWDVLLDLDPSNVTNFLRLCYICKVLVGIGVATYNPIIIEQTINTCCVTVFVSRVPTMGHRFIRILSEE